MTRRSERGLGRLASRSMLSAMIAFASLVAVETVASAAMPNAPGSVSASMATSSALVTWTAPTPVTGVTITGYTATASPGGQSCTLASSATTLGCTIPGLTASTSYTFSVYASSAGGNGPSATDTASSTAISSSTTALISSPLSPQNLNTRVTFTATVTSGATGTVNFKNGSTTITGCGTQVVSSGFATCSTSALPAGTNSVTGVYSGDTNYSGSTSSTLNYVISSTTLTAATSPLVITSTAKPFNNTFVMTTIGGNGSGAITYSVTNGTATGCSFSGATLSVPTNVSGTCLVTATQASAGTYLGDVSTVTAVNFFWSYAATLSSYISSYSCGTGASLYFNGTSYVCNYTATPTCPNGGTLTGSNCVTTSSTTYFSGCVNNSNGTATWTSWSYNAPYYGMCTWTLAATQTCPSGGGPPSGTTCTYAATPVYTWYWACPLGGTASVSTCNFAGGSGPNLRRSKMLASRALLAKVSDYLTKGTS